MPSFVANVFLSKTAKSVWRMLGRLLVCLALVACVTYAAFNLLRVNALVAGLAYLLLVFVIAAKWGWLESGTTSLAGMLSLAYFFLPPVYSLQIASPRDLVGFIVFTATSVIAIQLSTSARQRAIEAQSRQAEVERLYELSRSLMILDSRDVGVQIAEKVRQRFGFSCVAFCSAAEDRIDFAGIVDPRLQVRALREIATGRDGLHTRRTRDESGDEIVTAPISFDGRVVGSLGAIGPPVSVPAWQALATLASIAVERIRVQSATSRIEAARQSESLKGLLLDALAHDFVTPLASIKGAITTVRSEYPHTPDEEDLLTVVEEESDKLTGMVNETIDVARIEAGKLQLKRQQLPVNTLIDFSLNRMSSLLDNTPTEVRVPEGISLINADPELVSLALRQLISNAIKFSPPGAGVSISALESAGIVTLTVSDEGPGIPAAEIELIFERYYRGSIAQRSVAGTGMGLSIARDIISAHGGRIWAENRPSGGALFSFTLPVAESENQT
jgi:two-component system sensor histidine kinase KdpD